VNASAFQVLACKVMEATKPLQNKLFHETIEDAITTDVLAAGGYKKVGHDLRSDLTPETAAAWLRACLNVERAEKLSPGHVLQIKRMAKQAGSTAAIQYEAQQLHFQVTWIEPEDELTKLLREYLGDQQRQVHRKDRIDALIARTQLKAVG